MANIATTTEERRVVVGVVAAGGPVEIVDITQHDSDSVARVLANYRSQPHLYADVHVAVKTVATTYMRVVS